MENEILDKEILLDSNGNIIHEGWARQPYWEYDRKAIKANKLRIKEWDYYAITNFKEGYNICITFSDLGYAGLFSITYLDYKLGKYTTVSSTKPLTLHRTGLGANSKSDYGVTFADKNMTIAFVTKDDRRHILATAPNMVLPDGRTGLKVDITIKDNQESLNIATSWAEDRKCFYYNTKAVGMEVEGNIKIGFDRFPIGKDTTLGLLDWGRGRWYRTSTWKWSAIMGITEDGHRYGINTGYGFTDRTPASENSIIYDGIVHKLHSVTFSYPDDYTSDKWIIKDDEDRLYLEMEPIVNRSDHIDFKLIVSLQDQVFGRIKGYFILDDGTRVEVNTLGFAEHVHNKW